MYCFLKSLNFQLKTSHILLMIFVQSFQFHNFIPQPLILKTQLLNPMLLIKQLRLSTPLLLQHPPNPLLQLYHPLTLLNQIFL